MENVKFITNHLLISLFLELYTDNKKSCDI